MHQFELSPQLIRLPTVMAMTGRSRSSIYADIAAGRFPAPIKIGPRAVAWELSSVAEWVTARIAESRTGEVTKAS